ncbi:MAG TPA: DUF6666 family protein [Lacipirellulaceae bacterium]|nr:DUF6666 family protein [Lacipirellulaceae bacterium]
MASSRLFGLTTRSAATLFLASLAGFIAGQAADAASPTTGGWKAAGSAQPFSSDVEQASYTTSSAHDGAAHDRTAADNSKPAPKWRMPNGHIPTSNAQSAARPANRPAQRLAETVAAHYEPSAFEPSTSAKPISATQPRDITPTGAVQKQTPRVPIARSSAQRYSRPPAPVQPRHGFAGHPAMGQHRARGYMFEENPKLASKLWRTINVAFEGPDQLTTEPENLPLPAQRQNQGQVKSRIVPPSNHAPPMEGEIFPGPSPYGPGDDTYFHDGHSGACGGECGCTDCGTGCGDGMCGCEPGCGCGCDGEAGCACEASCGCPCGCGAESPCILACGDTVCLMGEGDAEACHTIRIGVPKWQEFMIFGGVHGFKGPYDQSRDSGNFGFHEGFNAGYKVPFSDAGYQIGYQAVHSQLHGDKDTGISDPHTQQFVTVGLFRRAQNGVQLGIAWDLLRDERFGAIDFHQLRTELALIDRGCHEFGLAVTAHLNEHEMFPADEDNGSPVFQATDQYLLFYRFHGNRGGEGRAYGGLNDDDDAIIGADLLIPIQERWSLATGFTYLIPEEDAGEDGAAHEAWNIGISLVWHWDSRARKSHSNCYRPLFNVADNGYMIIDERPGAPATGD